MAVLCLCFNQICQGGEVPRAYYLSETLNVDSMQTVNIAKGDKYVVEVKVDHPNSILRYLPSFIPYYL